MRPNEAPLNGRRAEAARNDTAILDAARDVFLADPSAPISAVAGRAGVGISALYRRYPSKNELLQALARDGLTRFIDALEAGLADEGDPWDSYASCLTRVVEGRSQALAQRIAGTFTPTAELMDLSARAGTLYHRLHKRTQQPGALRGDVTPADIVILLEMVSTIAIGGGLGSGDAVSALRLRYLSLLLQSLRDRGQEALRGVAASDDDLAGRWRAP